MKKIILFITLLLITSSLCAEGNPDKSEYIEISLVEINKLRQECSSNHEYEKIDGKLFKSKCHVIFIYWNDWMQWMQLSFTSEDERINGNWKQGIFSFPFSQNIKLFTAFEVYYHYDINYSHESFDLEFDYIDILDDIRFIGQKYIATDNLRIRAEPSLDSKKIGLLLSQKKLQF